MPWLLQKHIFSFRKLQPETQTCSLKNWTGRGSSCLLYQHKLLQTMFKQYTLVHTSATWILQQHQLSCRAAKRFLALNLTDTLPSVCRLIKPHEHAQKLTEACYYTTPTTYHGCPALSPHATHFVRRRGP